MYVVSPGGASPLPAHHQPGDAGLDHRGKADAPDRPLDIGRLADHHCPRRGDTLLVGQRHQRALVVRELYDLGVGERQHGQPFESRSRLGYERQGDVVGGNEHAVLAPLDLSLDRLKEGVG